MQITRARMLAKLHRHCGDQSVIEEAKRWLEQNNTDPKAIRILHEIENQSADAEQIIWCTRWLQRNPRANSTESVVGTLSHSQILVDQEKFAQGTNAESGRGLRQLLLSAVNEPIVAIARQWLVDFPNEKYSGLLLALLLEVDTSVETIEMAKSWLYENKNDSSYGSVLAKLLSNEASDEVLKLAQKLIKGLNRRGSIETVIAVLSTTNDAKLRKEALLWCNTFLQGEGSSHVAGRLEQLVRDPEVADLLFDWCLRNPKEPSVAFKWSRLLSKNPNEKIAQKCWEWLEPDDEQHDWHFAFQSFLECAVEYKILIPEAALAEGWKIWEEGDLSLCSHIGALLELDTRNDAAERLFLWAQANPQETETVSTILFRLIEVRPTNDVFEFATEWLESQKMLEFQNTSVLWKMLEVAPSRALIDITYKLLPTCADRMIEWFTLQHLIEHTNDESAIRRASQLVNIEARLAFRRHLDISCGELLRTLCERKVEGVENAAKQWLRWHAKMYPNFAKLIC